MAIVCFGSINMDLVVRTPRRPQAGETISGHTFFEAPGGKGANQAVAAAKLGANTAMVGRVGNDTFGAALLHQLQSAGVNTEKVTITPDTPSGIALITVEDSGQNSIIVVAGANGLVGVEDLAKLEQALIPAKVLLLQLEVPLDSVVKAARIAHQQGVTIILDPAPVPAVALPPELYTLASLLTPNETEAAALVGFPLTDSAAIIEAGKILKQRGPQEVIIKLGGQGVYWTDGPNSAFYPAFPAIPVDTVGAGDAFNAGLAVALDEEKSLREAIDWGLATGAIAVSRAGAQAAMPTRDEVLNLLGQA